MSSANGEHQAFPITFSSSVADDVWHAQKGQFAFESWHFDGLSEDGRQALIISFYDNFPFSPRYFHPERREGKVDGVHPHPAVSLVYSVDGKPVLSAVNEYSSAGFSTSTEGVNCTIGNSWFRVESADYGTGYVLSVELVSSRNRTIKAEFEWLSIEADLFRQPSDAQPAGAGWNIVSPRSDVSGRITVYEPGGEKRKLFHFRGTGSHDHLRSLKPLDEAIAARCWGRAHFVDSTAVFQCLKLHDGCDAATLLLISGDRLQELEARTVSNRFVLSRFGLRVPRELSFYTDEGIRLDINPTGVIESGFCEIKLLGRMVLTCGDDKPHETTGILALLSPGRLRQRLVRRLSGLRIGTNRRPPLF
jgi:hypothetical protein